MEYPQRRYQIYLKSSAGPIEVFLVSHVADEGAASGSAPPPAAAIAAVPPQPESETAQQTNGKRDRAAAEEALSPERRAAGGGGAEQLLKLSPVGAEQADYWNQMEPLGSNGSGVDDLFSLGA